MWPNRKETADLVAFTEKILNRNLHFLWSEADVGGILFKIILQKFRKIHRKALVSQSLSWQICKPQTCNFIRKRLQHKCFLVNFAKFLITLFLQNTSGQLITYIGKKAVSNWSILAQMFHFYIPWKRRKTKAFLTFSGGIKMEHWAKMS